MPLFASLHHRSNGTRKIRPVDNFSWSSIAVRSKKKRKIGSINGATALPERVQHNHLDDLAEVMRRIHEDCGQAPALWKLDVDAAFRRVPLREDHLWASKVRAQLRCCCQTALGRLQVAFLYNGQTYFSTHYACPFGSAASVHSWERLGALITKVVRKLLKIPTLRCTVD